VFAWKPADMPGVAKELIEHSLNVNLNATPKKQCLWRFSAEKREAIKKELAKLLAAGFIKEVYHPEWLANHVLVLKKNNKVEDVCRLHRPQQTLSERSFWASSHRPSHRIDGQLRSPILP